MEKYGRLDVSFVNAGICELINFIEVPVIAAVLLYTHSQSSIKNCWRMSAAF
jgi:hypothetical protein